MKNFWKTSCRK